VVISAALVSKQSKVLLARQFLDIPKSQIEGLLGSFIRLVDVEQQHTFIENEAARFVYQHFEETYLVLTTTKDSNIVEDIETLRLLQKIVQHYCPFGLDEANILKNSFEIIWAFDDVISLGHRESVTLGQLLTYAEMESAEERIFKEKQKQQMIEAKEIAKRKQKELDKKKAKETLQSREHPLPRFEEDFTQPEVPSPKPVEPEQPKKKPQKGMNLVSRGRKAFVDEF